MSIFNFQMYKKINILREPPFLSTLSTPFSHLPTQLLLRSKNAASDLSTVKKDLLKYTNLATSLMNMIDDHFAK